MQNVEMDRRVKTWQGNEKKKRPVRSSCQKVFITTGAENDDVSEEENESDDDEPEMSEADVFVVKMKNL